MTSDAHDWRALLPRLDGAYAPNTIRALRADWEAFEAFCTARGEHCLPACAETVAAFVAARGEEVRPGTVRRQLSSIERMHRVAKIPSPTHDEDVRLALRKLFRQKGRRRRQALGLDAELLEACVGACDTGTLQGKRDAALLLALYDTLCRRGEIAGIEVSDLAPTRESGYLVLVRRSKTDIEGEGRHAMIGPRAARALDLWLEAAQITSGPVFRGIRNGEPHWAGLSDQSVGYVLKNAARRARLPEEIVASLSGHSARVGRAQDMALAGHDHLAIMRAGGWRTIDVVARYVEAAELRRIDARVRPQTPRHGASTFEVA